MISLTASNPRPLTFSPPLAAKLALVTEGKSLLEIAQQVVQVIRPDLNRQVFASGN
jgi:hypothetical protein